MHRNTFAQKPVVNAMQLNCKSSCSIIRINPFAKLKECQKKKNEGRRERRKEEGKEGKISNKIHHMISVLVLCNVRRIPELSRKIDGSSLCPLQYTFSREIKFSESP